MPVVNGRPYGPIPAAEWPPIDEAMAVIDDDLSHADEGVRLWIHGDPPVVMVELSQELPPGSELPISHRGFVNVVGDTPEDALRHLAAIIKKVRIGGVITDWRPAVVS